MANRTITRAKSAKKLRPAGHSATIEALIQPAIVVGSTLMSAIAAYVLALDEITQILARRGTPADVFVVALCAGMGFLIDMAIIVSATRYKMHAVRDDPRERRWLQLAKSVLVVGLVSESMTLFYFFVHLDPAAFPDAMLWLANIIHAVLAISRAFLPPVVIAYFAAGVLPVMFDRADRNREIKSRTSSNIMLLVDRLSEVQETDDKAEMLRALGGQLMLDTYATYDETARTTEDQQLQRDAKLLAHLARIHRLDWSSIAADVGMVAQASPQGQPQGQPQPFPQGKRKEEEEPEPQPDPQPAPAPQQPIPLRPPERTPAKGTETREPAPALAPAARLSAQATRTSVARSRTESRTESRAERSARAGAATRPAVERAESLERMTLRQRREEAARRILAEQPDITNTRLAQMIAMATRYRIGESTARAIREQVTAEMAEMAEMETRTEQIASERAPLRIITPTLPPTITTPIVDEATTERRQN